MRRGTSLMGPLGLSQAALLERTAAAAARGNVEAQLLLASMRSRKRSGGVTFQLVSTWHCPTCGAGAASASGKDATVTCKRGHARAAHPVERSPVLRRLFRQ